MRAGLMRERVTLLSKSVTRDAIGGEVITWAEEDEVWADVEQLTGREYFGAQQIESEAEIRFRIRYRTDVTSAWRIEWRDTEYEIVAPPANVKMRNAELEIIARDVAHGS